MKKRVWFSLFIIGFFIFLTLFIRKEYTHYVFRRKSENIQKRMDQLSDSDRKNETEHVVQAGNPLSEDIFDGERMAIRASADEVGYLMIPKINQSLPLYLGVTDTHLANGVAQITGTSLPLQGVKSNTVIAGHRGYYGALLFRDLDQLEAGDLIYINYFGEEAIYRVSNQSIIVPEDTEALKPQEGKELLTLFTWHPYPQNSHRLLVQSERLKIKKVDSLVLSSEINKEMEHAMSDFLVIKEPEVQKNVVMIGSLLSLFCAVALLVRGGIGNGSQKK